MDESINAPIAAVDLGSNSFHLLIGRFVQDHFQVLGREKVRVQLAEGLDANDELSEAAIERGLDVLRLFNERLKEIPAERIRIVATYTLRQARNSRDFLRRARRFLPCPIEVIPGHEEARLIYQGVAHTQQGNAPMLVIDIGGGSTECIIGEGFHPLRLRSLNIGCVTLSEHYFPQGKVQAKQLKKAELAAGRIIEPIVKSYRQQGWKQALGCSGTIKAISDCLVQLGAERSDITTADLKQLGLSLIEDGEASITRFPHLSAERARVLPGGLAILSALFNALQIEQLQISEAALREGLLYEMEARMQHHDIRERTATSLIERYHVEPDQAARVQAMALTLYQHCKTAWQLSGNKLKPLLNWAASLHEIGTAIDFKGFHRHGAYIVEHTPMPGFNADEQQLVATLIRFQRKRLPEQLPTLSLFDEHHQRALILILRLAVLLNLHRSDEEIPVEFSVQARQLTLTFASDWLDQHPLLESRLEQEKKEWKRVKHKLVFTPRTLTD